MPVLITEAPPCGSIISLRTETQEAGAACVRIGCVCSLCTNEQQTILVNTVVSAVGKLTITSAMRRTRTEMKAMTLLAIIVLGTTGVTAGLPAEGPDEIRVS